MWEVSDLSLVIVLIIIIEGVWLAGLTYLMWRRHIAARNKKMQQEEQSQPEETN